MRIKIITFLVLGISATGVCFAQSNPNDPKSTSVTTKMNGNSTTASGVAISSTSIGSEGRNTPSTGI